MQFSNRTLLILGSISRNIHQFAARKRKNPGCSEMSTEPKGKKTCQIYSSMVYNQITAFLSNFKRQARCSSYFVTDP